jgi:hypothetical protein
LLSSVTRCEIIARIYFSIPRLFRTNPCQSARYTSTNSRLCLFSVHLSPHFHAPLTCKARHNEHISTHDRCSGNPITSRQQGQKARFDHKISYFQSNPQTPHYAVHQAEVLPYYTLSSLRDPPRRHLMPPRTHSSSPRASTSEGVSL